jgi:hypothetical protein
MEAEFDGRVRIVSQIPIELVHREVCLWTGKDDQDAEETSRAGRDRPEAAPDRRAGLATPVGWGRGAALVHGYADAVS